MSEMVERVALILANRMFVQHWFDQKFPSPPSTASWGDYSAAEQSAARLAARAVIETMREPTDSMSVAGHDAGERVGEFTCHKPYAPAVWRAEIDKALE